MENIYQMRFTMFKKRKRLFTFLLLPVDAKTIVSTLHGTLCLSRVCASPFWYVTVMSRAQPGNRCPIEGENVRKGNGSHEKRTVSLGEWLVRVKLSIFGMLILQSPKRSWFEDGTIKYLKNNTWITQRKHTNKFVRKCWVWVTCLYQNPRLFFPKQIELNKGLHHFPA